MGKKTKIGSILGMALVIILIGLFVTKLMGQNKQEIVLTIEGFSSDDKLAAFALGEELRKQMKFEEAIKEYIKVISGSEVCGKEAEAHYSIGICYIWLGKKDAAEAVFKEVLNTYPDDAKVIAYTKYCLSWVDVQRENFNAAIERLQQTLDEKLCSEEEFCSRAQFQIGRIYLSFIYDYERAEQAFRKVLENYPDSEITNHPFLEKLKGETD